MEIPPAMLPTTSALPAAATTTTSGTTPSLALLPTQSPNDKEAEATAITMPDPNNNNNNNPGRMDGSSRSDGGGGGGGAGPWWANPGAISNRLGAALVGRAIRGMYEQLENQYGFQPGQEFVLAMKAAASSVPAMKGGGGGGTDIVLGDQNVQVTLQRLAAALAVTDWDQLLAKGGGTNPTTSMEALLPSAKTMDLTSSSQPKQQQQEQESPEIMLTGYVDTLLRDRNQLRAMMGELEEAAPALVQVLLTERNAYMAAGIHALVEYPILVAVVGMAHQEGMERNLQAVGWQPVSPNAYGCDRRPSL